MRFSFLSFFPHYSHLSSSEATGKCTTRGLCRTRDQAQVSGQAGPAVYQASNTFSAGKHFSQKFQHCVVSQEPGSGHVLIFELSLPSLCSDWASPFQITCHTNQFSVPLQNSWGDHLIRKKDSFWFHFGGSIPRLASGGEALEDKKLWWGVHSGT